MSIETRFLGENGFLTCANVGVFFSKMMARANPEKENRRLSATVNASEVGNLTTEGEGNLLCQRIRQV